MELEEQPSHSGPLNSRSDDEDQGSDRRVVRAPRPSLEQTAVQTVSKDAEQEYLTGLKLLATMISVTLVGFLMLLDTAIVATAIPRITDQFHSLTDVGWYGTAYLLANCALQPLTGKIYTLFSNKWAFLSFFAVFELGSLLCGVATSSKMLIVGRAIAGMGGAGLLNGGYTIVDASVIPDRKPGLLGIVTGGSALGLLCGPVVGGLLTQYASWRWCFYINLPCGAVVLFLLLFIDLPDRNAKDIGNRTLGATLRRLDLIGFALFAGFSIQILIALNWGGSKYPWDSSVIIGLFPGAVGVLCAFAVWEAYMGGEAMIPYSLIRRRVVWSSCINYGFFAGCLLTTTYYLPIYFQATRKASPTMSGVDLLPSILGTVLFSMATGALVQRIGYYLPFAVASGGFTMLGSGLLSTLTPTTSIGKWIGYQILAGVGRGLGLQTPVLAVQHNSQPGEVSIVTGLVVFSQQFGGAIFLSLAQVVFSSGLRAKLASYAPDVDSATVVAAGATAVRNVVPPASLPGVLMAYSKAYDQVMYLATGAAGVALLSAFGMGWVNIKKKDQAIEVVPEEKETPAPLPSHFDFGPGVATGSDTVLVDSRRH